jgi:hypothetical protein
MPKVFGYVAVVALAIAAPSTRASADSTPYDCSALHVAAVPSGGGARAIAAWRELAEARELDAGWAMRVFVDALATPPDLSVEARVRVQHQLVAIAKRLVGRDEPTTAFALGVVVGLVRASAPTAAELAALGDPASPRVAAVLGPRDAIAQRATNTCGEGNSIHAHRFQGEFAFRPLRVGTTHALVAQLVAFDRDGVPHATPLVEQIELRLGDDVDAPACVVAARDDGALRAMPFDELHEHRPFVVRAGDGSERLTCGGCHTSPDAMGARDIAGDELARVDALRGRQLERLATQRWQTIAQVLAAREMRDR